MLMEEKRNQKSFPIVNQTCELQELLACKDKFTDAVIHKRQGSSQPLSDCISVLLPKMKHMPDTVIGLKTCG